MQKVYFWRMMPVCVGLIMVSCLFLSVPPITSGVLTKVDRAIFLGGALCAGRYHFFLSALELVRYHFQFASALYAILYAVQLFMNHCPSGAGEGVDRGGLIHPPPPRQQARQVAVTQPQPFFRPSSVNFCHETVPLTMQ
jgi:hypothetical protein